MRRKIIAFLGSAALTLGSILLTVSAAGPANAATWSCTVTGPNTTCPVGADYNDYPGIVMSNGANTYVANNCWADPSCSQTLNANDGTDWQVTAKEPAGNGSVMTGPELQQQTNDWCASEKEWASQIQNGCSDMGNVPISALSSWTSSYTESLPHNSQTIAEGAYDIWTNYPNDVMVWNDVVNRCSSGAFGSTTLATGVTIGGNTYDVYRYGGVGAEIIFVLEGSGGAGTCAQVSSGSVDILGVLNWLQTNGYISNITVSLVDYTFEVCSTGGQPENFALSSYSMSTQTGGGGTQQAPAVTTNAASGVTSSGATLNGSVNPEGAATTYQFDYGTTTSYGSSVPSPAGSVGSGTSAVNESQSLTGLSPSTTYHYRIEATNSRGTTYGSDQTFTMSAGGSSAPALVAEGPVASSLSPSFGASAKAGDLLVAYLSDNSSSSTDPFGTTAAGWQEAAVSGGPYYWTSIWYKANSGAGEAAPVFTSAGASVESSMLAEFSNVATSSPLDRTGSGSGTSAETATASAADSVAGDLILSGTVWNSSNPGPTSISTTISDSSGSNVTANPTNDASTTGAWFYDFAYAVAGSTLGTHADSATSTLGVYSDGAAVLASFRHA